MDEEFKKSHPFETGKSGVKWKQIYDNSVYIKAAVGVNATHLKTRAKHLGLSYDSITRTSSASSASSSSNKRASSPSNASSVPKKSSPTGSSVGHVSTVSNSVELRRNINDIQSLPFSESIELGDLPPRKEAQESKRAAVDVKVGEHKCYSGLTPFLLFNPCTNKSCTPSAGRFCSIITADPSRVQEHQEILKDSYHYQTDDPEPAPMTRVNNLLLNHMEGRAESKVVQFRRSHFQSLWILHG